MLMHFRGLSRLVCFVLFASAITVASTAKDAVAKVPLIEAVKQGDVATVRSLLSGQSDVDAAEPDGTTALHWAAHLGDALSADLLLDAGANLNATTRNGATPYSLASYKGHAGVIERFLEAGADPNAEIYGEPVLMMVARAGDPDAIRALLSYGADPNVDGTDARPDAAHARCARGERRGDSRVDL